MSNKAKPKRVLITGCSSGFGLLTAVKAAKKGYECIATMRNLDKSDSLRSQLANADVRATIEQLDVTDHEAIQQIAEKYRPIDILINNAGILILGSGLDITEEEMRRVFETNYFGAVALTRAVVPAMIDAGSGRIINIASLAGLVGHLLNATYSASKHALIGFSRSMRLELSPFNIKVVSVEPGYHKTEIIRSNANVSENFYNPDSPMVDYNKGFLRLMFEEILPRAGEPSIVVDKILAIMAAANPKEHYVIGKDAKFATTARWLGLEGMLEGKVREKLRKATARQKRRDDRKREKRNARSKST